MSRFWQCLAVMAAIATISRVGAAKPSARELEEVQQLDTEAERLRDAGRYADAVPVARRALAIRERVLGPEHLDVAASLDDLASLLGDSGDYGAAKPFARRALAIYEKALGHQHPNVATSLNNLAVLHYHEGDYQAAEPLYRRALAIREKALGRKHPDVATSLNNLALLLRDKGDLATAEPLYRRALVIQEEAFGPEHPALTPSLSNLAMLLGEKGDLAAQEQFLRRALAIREKALGPQHPDVAVSLNNLALVLRKKGDDAAAEPLYRRALAIYEVALGADHPLLAGSLSNLALLLREKGDQQGAEPLLRRALAISENALGPEHPSVATKLNNLADVLWSKGDVDGAEPLFRRALAISENALGPEHPDTGESLSNLATLLWSEGRDDAAEALFRRALDVFDRSALRILQTGSGREKQAFFETMEDDTFGMVSFHVRGRPREESTLELALRTVLRRKGLATEVGGTALRALQKRAARADRRKLKRLASARADLARAALSGPAADETPAAHTAAVSKLTEEVENLERGLAARYAELRIERAPVTVGSVQASVPSGAALVEYVLYRVFDPNAKVGQSWGEWRYTAYVLPHAGKPSWVDLGAAQPIDEAARAYRGSLAGQSLDFVPAARKLEKLVFEPVRALLGAVRDLYVAADGALSLIPFASLVDANERFLIEQYRFDLLSSGRDLLRYSVRGTPLSAPLVVGGPDYGPLEARATPEDGSRGARSLDFAKVRFPALPGALQEAKQIAAALPEARVLTGAQATEGELKRVHSPRILHVATHGFFLADADAPGDAGQRALTLQRDGGRSTLPEDPMLRAGLALAGANPRQSGRDDGILTAAEASQLDLWGTQLVVLSACETGMGQVSNSDGVSGLRRALVASGSETQVMSLWKVDDAATRELMTRYYQRVLGGGGRIDALREVQLEMLAAPASAHPYYWAAFIAAGDPRTMSYAAPPPVRLVQTKSPTDALKVPPRGGCACTVPFPEAGSSGAWAALAVAIALAARTRRGSSVAGA